LSLPNLGYGVLERLGVWHSGETGEVIGEADLASRFHVDGQRIALFARYDSLDVALAEAGLAARDEVAQTM
jgi:hypothetical protein